ncbi:MAG: DUF4912 domain-containing protein [Sphaerochaetaceae bacterium]|nr:DUF4912 domain-containing protein [Sphaerochaetaceae bacterium]
MLLLNIETLSDSELKYMAEQEQLEDWEEMTREELIEGLEEVFGDTSDENSPLFGNFRFVKGLTDVDPGSLSLPGVSPLPETYNETYIYAVLKDANWAYAMWNISPLKMEELMAENRRLCLRVSAGMQEYDIDIDYEDTCWNIELPWHGYSYTISLLSYTGEEKEDSDVLCSVGNIESPKFFFSDHIKELQDKNTFKLVFSSLFTKEGKLLRNEIVSGIFKEVEARK